MKLQSKSLNGIYYEKNNFVKSRKNLVFLHGYTASLSIWEQYISDFSNNFNIVLIDLRGHGKSIRSKDFKDYSISNLSSDIYNILKKERMKKAVLVGHSFSNLIIIDLAANKPDFLNGIILLGPDFLPCKDLTSPIIRFLSNFLYKISFTWNNKKRGYHVDYKKYIGKGDPLIGKIIEDMWNMKLKNYFALINNAYNYNELDFLDKIKIPSLIIHGEEDKVISYKKSIKLAQKLKKSKLIILKKAEHAIILNEKKRVLRGILDFMKTINNS